MNLLFCVYRDAFNAFATNEAIQCTEVYEYTKKLSQPTFVLPHFQQYKFLYATRLFENGFSEEVRSNFALALFVFLFFSVIGISLVFDVILQALHYCEVISSEVLKTPAMFSPELVSQLLEVLLSEIFCFRYG